MKITEMLGMIGTQDMILFFLVLLLLFGAKKLPELARGIGKTMGEFKKAREEFEREVSHSIAQGETETKAKDPEVKEVTVVKESVAKEEPVAKADPVAKEPEVK